MVIYEVSLTINCDVYPQFQSWLKSHVKEMLQLPGFVQASILSPEDSGIYDQEKLIVQYHLESRDALEFYFTQFSAKMREEGLALFNDKFYAERKIYKVCDIL